MAHKYRKKHNIDFDIDKYFLPIILVIVCFILGIWFVTDSSKYITSAGIVEGKLFNVASKSQGYIIQTFVDEGQEVRKGDPLMEIDPSDYEYQLRQAEDKIRELNIKSYSDNSKLNKFYPETKEKKSMFSFSQKDFGSYDKTFGESSDEDKDVNSKIKTDEIQAGVAQKDNEEKRELSPEEIKKEIKKLESIIEQLKLNISYTKICAPQDGIISVRQVRTGDYVEIAQTVCSIIPKRVWVSGKFNDTMLQNIKEGQPVIIKIHKYPNRKFKGVVDYVPNLENKHRTENDTVKIMFTEDYSEYNIPPGTPAELKIKIK